MLAAMGRSRVPAVVATTAAVALVIGAALMYLLNPFDTASHDPRGRIVGFIPYRIPSRGMEPTVHEGELVVVSTWRLARQEPRTGEIIAFFYPPNPEFIFIQRVVASGGMTVEMRGGVVSVDGHALAEPYISRGPCMIEGCGELDPVVVPAGHFFVLGDNRGNSADSREWGFVPRELVIGVYEPGD